MRDTAELHIAVTGMNATDNPGPGVGVARALRHSPDFRGKVIGLAYDTLEPGVYARDIIDDVFLVPYPSQGVEALEARLRYIHDRVGLDVVIPTLDAELPSFIALAPVFEELGIGSLLPSQEQLDLRSKANLCDLGERSAISVPKTRVVTDMTDLYTIHKDIPYPFFVKGLFYGAVYARSLDDALHGFHRTVAQWGLPVIVQAAVPGDEFDVVAVGDGEGGLVGAVAMKKTFLTDKGKGWAGVVVKDPRLLKMAQVFMETTKWRGPCEVEVMMDRSGTPHLIEVNPRFPAWCYLSAGAGTNLPWAVARLAAGEAVETLPQPKVGTMFVRISLDQVTDMADFERLATTGEIVSTTNEGEQA